MSYITSAFPAPQLISNEATSGSAVVLLTAAAVYVYAFEVNTPTTINSIRWRTGATAAGKTNVGLYTSTGNLVANSDSGQQNNAINTENIFTYSTPILLAPGQYFMALSASANTDDYQGSTGAGNSLPMTRNRLATNAVSAGALPPTLGALSSTTVAPMIALLPAGGLS